MVDLTFLFSDSTWNRPQTRMILQPLSFNQLPLYNKNPCQEVIEETQLRYKQLKKIDAKFDLVEFVKMAESIFFSVYTALCTLNVKMLEPIMSHGLYLTYETRINEYLERKITPRFDNLVLRDVCVERIEVEKNQIIAIRFFIEAQIYDLDSRGYLLRGDYSTTGWSEDWVFIRSNTVKTNTESVDFSNRCPNCSAPLELVEGTCMYCNVWVSSGQYDWVLQTIKREGNLLSSWESRGEKAEDLVKELG